MRKLPKVLTGIFAAGVALTLAGCSTSGNKQSASQSNKPKTTKVEKRTASVKKSNGVKKDNNTNSDQKTQNNKSDKAKFVLTPSDKKALSSEPNPNKNGINLGHGVVAHEDHGAGQTYVTFSDNGKNYTVHGNDVQNNANAIDKAKQIVNNPSGYNNNSMIQANGTK